MLYMYCIKDVVKISSPEYIFNINSYFVHFTNNFEYLLFNL